MYKSPYKLVFLSIFLLLTCFWPFYAQAQVTKETYQNAAYFLTGNLQKEIYHLEVIPNWSQDSTFFWHVTQTENGKRFFLTTLSNKETKEAFDHTLLARLLSENSDEEIDSRDLPFDKIELHAEGQILFEWKSKLWKFDKQEESLKAEVKKSTSEPNGVSPDKKWKAFTKDYNLFVENLETGEETQLSYDGKKDFEYASYYGWSDMIYGENGQRPKRFMAKWSPDSKKIFTQIVDLRLAEKMYLLDFSQDDKFRPDLLSYYRGSPGDTTVVKYLPVIFDVANKTETQIPELIHPHFMSIMDMDWSEDNNSFTGIYMPRGFKSIRVIEVDANSGGIKTVYSESSETNIEREFNFKRITADKFLMTSPKSGNMHLYLFDSKAGEEFQLTKGEFVVNNVLHIDEENKWVYFMASGKESHRNPYYQHLYKLKLDGSNMILLTPENAFHEIHLSPDKNYYIDNYSEVDQPTQSVLRKLETGEVVKKISEADISNLLAKGYQSPKQFSATAKDDITEIYGVYFLPTTFDTELFYPIIDYTYTGPHTAVTPKTFKAGLLGLQQSMAEMGFVVVTIDGMGTAGRSKAFSDVSYRNLGYGTTDHVLAIKQLASQNAFMDIERVGIFGHSAGGYDAARAMLLHPDFYKVGVASAGDHDHRMEKAWWPEMYMGYPVEEYYNEQSNITNAANLKGRLLLAHGAIDENVNPSATYKFAEALIKAGKDFDLFIWPSRDHNFGRPPGDYFTKKRWDYFLLHLKGEQPLLHYQLED